MSERPEQFTSDVARAMWLESIAIERHSLVATTTTQIDAAYYGDWNRLVEYAYESGSPEGSLFSTRSGYVAGGQDRCQPEAP